MAAKISKAAPAAKPAGSTSGAGGDKSATRTASNTKTATETSTEAFTQGNITVTGGAGKGATIVHIGMPVEKAAKSKTGTSKVGTATPKASGSGSSHTSQK